MPHLTYEFTDNLADENIQELLEKSSQILINQDGIFPIGGIRVRGQCLTHYVIADGKQPKDAFVHAQLKIGKGRKPEQIQKVCDELFELMCSHFSEVFSQSGLALSLEYVEFENGTWKKNNLHVRYRKD